MVTYDGHLFEMCNNVIVSDLNTISKDKQASLLEIKVQTQLDAPRNILDGRD